METGEGMFLSSFDSPALLPSNFVISFGVRTVKWERFTLVLFGKDCLTWRWRGVAWRGVRRNFVFNVKKENASLFSAKLLYYLFFAFAKIICYDMLYNEFLFYSNLLSSNQKCGHFLYLYLYYTLQDAWEDFDHKSYMFLDKIWLIIN
jgi:hypothetical protein